MTRLRGSRPEVAFELCEQYAIEFIGVRRSREGKRPEACDVEFAL